MKKKIITMGTALALALSMGMTVSAGHHGACAGSVIRGSGLRQYERSHEGGHHLYCYGGGQDCAYWGIDVSGVCDYWEYCHGGAAYGTAHGAAVEDQAPAAAPESQSDVSAATESQSPAATAGDSYYGGNAGYGYGRHHGGWSDGSGSYGGACHGSGHHGRGHH